MELIPLLPVLVYLQMFPQLVSTEALPAPSLSLHPQLPKYLLGDSVAFICSAPPHAGEMKEFRFSRNGMTVSIPVPWNNATYSMNITSEKDWDSYQCSYVIWLSERFVHSKKSEPVFIQGPGTGVNWVRILAVGSSFFMINGLIFFISHCCLKRKITGTPNLGD